MSDLVQTLAAGAIPGDSGNSAPWRDLEVTAAEVNQVPSMMGADEALYLYWLARTRYRGDGAIVDGGPLLGGSTMALARGLTENEAVADKAGRIHSYDLFEYSPYLKRVFRGRPEPAVGSSFLAEFERHVAPWRALVNVYPGDITARRWSGDPIEILFIDVAKTWDIQRHLLREFFPALIPGRAIVVQQDYFFVSCYWIHLVMEALSDYFRISAMADVSTLAFDLVAPIPAHLLQVDYETLSKEEAVKLMDRSLARFTGRKRLIAETAKVSLLLAYRDRRAAARTLDAIRQADAFDDRVAIDWDKAAQRLQEAEARRRAAAMAASES